MSKVVYEIRCPITDMPVYVGSTIRPSDRFSEHMAPSRAKRLRYPDLQNWITSLRTQGLKPKFVIISRHPNNIKRETLIQYEKAHTQLLSKSFALFNKFLGSNHTAETRAWVAEGNRRRILSKDTKIKMGQKNIKYIFHLDDGSKVVGLKALYKVIGVKMTTLHYQLSVGKLPRRVKHVEHRV